MRWPQLRRFHNCTDVPDLRRTWRRPRCSALRQELLSCEIRNIPPKTLAGEVGDLLALADAPLVEVGEADLLALADPALVEVGEADLLALADPALVEVGEADRLALADPPLVEVGVGGDTTPMGSILLVGDPTPMLVGLGMVAKTEDPPAESAAVPADPVLAPPLAPWRKFLRVNARARAEMAEGLVRRPSHSAFDFGIAQSLPCVLSCTCVSRLAHAAPSKSTK